MFKLILNIVPFLKNLNFFYLIIYKLGLFYYTPIPYIYKIVDKVIMSFLDQIKY